MGYMELFQNKSNKKEVEGEGDAETEVDIVEV